jgi:hypothetical protein
MPQHGESCVLHKTRPGLVRQCDQRELYAPCLILRFEVHDRIVYGLLRLLQPSQSGVHSVPTFVRGPMPAQLRAPSIDYNRPATFH